jgi:lipopolysaccharide/colanic/teichoic acid biosynthesis glycosyltransferase
MKRIFDFLISFVAIVVLSPIFMFFIILVFLQDFKSPFYVANRVGKNGYLFKMIKLRSMGVNADKSGLSSTSSNDMRITPIGKIIRKYKLDELTQLFNVFFGHMSIVGPRPNVTSDVGLYTKEEMGLLSIRPGITDIASIVFSDEGEILSVHQDADKAYQQLIRPGKGALGLYYVNNQSFSLDLSLIFLTILAIISKQKALRVLFDILNRKNADPDLLETVSRRNPLIPCPPVGSNTIFETRN